MTLLAGCFKCNGKVVVFPSDSYARGRARLLVHDSFREEAGEPAPTERLLQEIWQHQRLLRDQLRLADGRSLRVLHPGFWNYEAGPDFRGAVLQFDDPPARTGDVEIDLSTHNWRHHHHDLNPAYQKVILHVVWTLDARVESPLPTLAIAPFLDAPLAELRLCLGAEAGSDLPALLRGRCSAPLAGLNPGEMRELLHQAARARLESKAARLQARARQAGWDQALWEGIFEALGYKHNGWPMRRLAELLPLLLPPAEASQCPLPRLQARLLGVGGLLPAELDRSRSSSSRFLRELWNCWWRERARFADCILPPDVWRLYGLRPANHPARRLALAAHWLTAGDLAGKLEQWFLSPKSDAELVPSLLGALEVGTDQFWTWHRGLRSRRLPEPQPLLGPPRATDLAMNVFLPWFRARVAVGNNAALRDEAERRYFHWPQGEDNSLLRQARRRLFGNVKGSPVRYAFEQQGLIQIVRDFCDRSNALCDDCQFPHLVRQMTF